MGFTETRVVRTGAPGPAATRLPTVTSSLPTRPETGARTCVYDRFNLAEVSAACAARRLASASCAALTRSSSSRRAIALSSHSRYARLRGDDLRLRAVDLGGVRVGIDGDEQIVALYQRALGEVHRLDRAGDSRAHVDALDRFEAPGKLVPRDDLVLLDHRNLHRHRLRRRSGGFGLCARGTQIE